MNSCYYFSSLLYVNFIHRIQKLTKRKLSRLVFDSTIAWAIKSGDSPFWKPSINRNRISESHKEILMNNRKAPAAAKSHVSKSDE